MSEIYDKVRDIQDEVREREWSHQVSGTKTQFHQEVYTLKTWVDNTPESPRVEEVLDDIHTLLNAMILIENNHSTRNVLFLIQKREEIEELKG